MLQLISLYDHKSLRDTIAVSPPLVFSFSKDDNYLKRHIVFRKFQDARIITCVMFFDFYVEM